MPQSIDIPSFFSLTPDRIEDQIGDLRRQKAGATLIYAIDPHEIFDFCFPVLGSDVETKDVRRIADDQIALYEVFFKIQPAPLLLAEYGPELEKILLHFSREASHGFNRLETVKTMLEREGDSGRGAERLENYILRNFNVLLAAVMGIYSSGASRLHDIAGRLSEPRTEAEAAALADAFIAYRPSASTDKIFDLLIKGVRFRDAFDEQRIRGSARVDALVIDKLISVNESLIRAHRQGKLQKPIQCLYLSSAPRSARVFNAEGVKGILPDLEGIPFNFWRTRAQVFSSVVYGGTTLDGAIERLEQLRKVLDRTIALKELAVQHAKGGTGEIKTSLEDLVKELTSELERRRKEATNLGLVSNLEKFQELTQVVGQKDKSVVQLFLEIYNQKRPDDALEDMRTALRLMVSQSEFCSDLSRNMFASSAPGLAGRDPSRSVQYLAVRTTIPSDSKHFETYNQFVQLYAIHLSRTEAIKTLLGIYNQFLLTQPAQQEPEYELIRCLLYLSFFSVEGNKKAYALARALSNQFEQYRYEFAYIQGWASRRLGLLQEAYETSLTCVKEKPYDPRFHHSHAASIHMLSIESNGAQASLTEAVAEIELAIVHYKMSRSDHADLIGTCYNSLAYYLSRDPDDICFDLSRAHEALKQLKVYIPSNIWWPMHPEYYHTEANLEFQDSFLVEMNKEKRLEKLHHARKAIDHAITLFAQEEYRVLKANIENELMLLGSGADAV
jgi:hypothetical protein